MKKWLCSSFKLKSLTAKLKKLKCNTFNDFSFKNNNLNGMYNRI